MVDRQPGENWFGLEDIFMLHGQGVVIHEIMQCIDPGGPQYGHFHLYLPGQRALYNSFFRCWVHVGCVLEQFIRVLTQCPGRPESEAISDIILLSAYYLVHQEAGSGQGADSRGGPPPSPIDQLARGSSSSEFGQRARGGAGSSAGLDS